MLQPVFLFISLLLVSVSVSAEIVRVAVASNFHSTMKKLVDDYHQHSADRIVLSSASSGKLFAQINYGAPYDLFFSADVERASRLQELKKGTVGKIYAHGQLLYIARGVKNCVVYLDAILNSDSSERMAVANPKTAPYGQAGKEFLQSINVWEKIQPRLIMGENILQAFQFIDIGRISSGFIAASLLTAQHQQKYCQWAVPPQSYQPIRQKVVMLGDAENNIAVKNFYQYISSSDARKIIEANGYVVPITRAQ